MATSPQTDAALGNSLISIGEQQVQTGLSLKRAAKDVRAAVPSLAEDGQVNQSVEAVRKGAVDIRSLLAPVVTALQFIVDKLNGVTVPTIEFETTMIGVVRVVTSIAIGTTHPFAQIAERVDTLRAQLADLREQLNTVATALQTLRDRLPSISRRFVSAADEMETAGATTEAAGRAMKQAGRTLGGRLGPA